MHYAWIMNSGFAAYGLTTAIAALIWFRRHTIIFATLVVFGSGLIGAALFSALPIDPSLPRDLTAGQLHSVFSSLTGSGNVAATATRLFWPTPNITDRLSWAALIASIALPAAMFALPDYAGVLQRLMFTTSFIWVWRQFAK